MTPDNSFLMVFYQTFAQVFELWNTPMQFPEPLDTVTPFDITMFFYVASMLAGMVNNIVSRRGDDS